MTVLFNILLFLHIVGAALVFGLWVANFRPPRVLPGQFHASLLQLVTGLAMWGMKESPAMGGMTADIRVKLGVKLLIGLVVCVLAFVGQRKYKKGEQVPTGIAHGVGGLALINIAIATLWQ